MKYIIFLLTLLLSKPGNAQKTIHNTLPPDKNTWIDFNILEGTWETIDTPKCKIEFEGYGATVIWKNEKRTYLFTKDSLNRMYSSGCYINWPPFNCDLKLIDENNLEVTFSQIGVPASTMKFRKRR